MTSGYINMRPIRFLTVTTLAAASAVLFSAPALADIPPSDGGVNIPGMAYGVERGTACDHRSDRFGRDGNGMTLVCVPEDDDDAYIWVRSAPLAGIRQITFDCSHESDMVALSPDNRLLQCLPNTPPSPKKASSTKTAWQWTAVEF